MKSVCYPVQSSLVWKLSPAKLHDTHWRNYIHANQIDVELPLLNENLRKSDRDGAKSPTFHLLSLVYIAPHL